MSRNVKRLNLQRLRRLAKRPRLQNQPHLLRHPLPLPNAHGAPCWVAWPLVWDWLGWRTASEWVKPLATCSCLLCWPWWRLASLAISCAHAKAVLPNSRATWPIKVLAKQPNRLQHCANTTLKKSATTLQRVLGKPKTPALIQRLMPIPTALPMRVAP